MSANPFSSEMPPQSQYPQSGAKRRIGQHAPPVFVGDDPAIARVRAVIDQVASSEASVLITGETGTGKEIVAREIHMKSARTHAPYLAVNCGAINESLQESELFGHVAGAFTGATARKRGLFETADGGTVFLDEIGETSQALQVRLLRTLQSGEFSPVGTAECRFCNVRVIAATNRELRHAVRDGGFRADLYYRLNVIRVHLPPLRERRADILPLAHHFLAMYADAYAQPVPALEPALESFLLSYDYPGNVRELENIVHRAVVLGRGGPCSMTSVLAEMEDGTPRMIESVPVPELKEEAASEPADISVDDGCDFANAKQQMIERFERDYVARMLRESGGIIRRAAQRAGLSERNFHEKLRRYGIDGLSFRG